MQNTLKRAIFLMAVPTLLCLWMSVTALSAETAPLNKVGATTVSVTTCAPDGTVSPKVVELTDGSMATRLMIRPGVSQIRVVFDMGTARTVGKIRVANYPVGTNANRGIKDVDVFVGDTIAPATEGTPTMAKTQIAMSTDATVWTEIALPQPVKGRYLTLRIINNWGGANYAVSEVENYTQEADAAPATPPATTTTTTTTTPGTATTTTTAPGTTTTTTTTTTPPVEKKPASPIVAVTQYDSAGTVVATVKLLTDGDYTTRWNGIPQGKTADAVVPIRLQLDLGTAQTVKQVRIANYNSPSHMNNNRGIKTVDIFVGDALAPAKDGTPAVADKVIAISDEKGTVWTTIDLPKPVSGRYITVRIKDNWGGNNYAANEIEVALVPVTADKP